MNSYALANLGGIIMCEAWDDLSRMRNQEAEDLLQRYVEVARLILMWCAAELST